MENNENQIIFNSSENNKIQEEVGVENENRIIILISFLSIIYILLFLLVMDLSSHGSGFLGFIYSIIWLICCYLISFKKVIRMKLGILAFMEIFGASVLLSAIFISIGFYFEVYWINLMKI